MKQHITIDQFETLSAKQKKTLIRWALNKKYVVGVPNGIDGALGRPFYVPLLSIGQMMEFLDEDAIYNSLRDWYKSKHDIESYVYIPKKKWCDALWKAVKEALEK